MIHIGSLITMTKKELFDLLVLEKRTSYRRGYKAGAAMRYRHPLPEKYGDSLPLKESSKTLTSEQ